MGIAERLVDRQIDRGQGTRLERIRAARTAQGFLAVACVLGLLAVGINLLGTGPYRGLWAGLGVLWVVVGVICVRQRRYVTRLERDERRPGT